MKLHKCQHEYPHLCSEGLCHLLWLLDIKSAEMPLVHVAISCESKHGYSYPGYLHWRRFTKAAVTSWVKY